MLFAVLDDAWCIYKSDPLQKFVRNLNTNQLLQKILAKLLKGREGPGTVSGHDNALNGFQLGPMHQNGELGCGGLSTYTQGEIAGKQSSLRN